MGIGKSFTISLLFISDIQIYKKIYIFTVAPKMMILLLLHFTVILPYMITCDK